MNSFAKCQIRKPQMMHVLGGYLDGRIDSLSPQNVANVAHAHAKLECYNHPLFSALQQRLKAEDLQAYKLYELSVLTHSFAKLRCGGKPMFYHENLVRLLLQVFLETFHDAGVHPLTQSA